MVYVTASASSCGHDPGQARCSPDTLPSDLIAIVIAVVIVGLVLFNVWWKYGRGRAARGAKPPNGT